jgi:hypothetical protein
LENSRKTRRGKLLAMATLPLTRGIASAQPGARTSLWFGVPWFVWASAASVSCAVFGLHFDVAWHRSIGRDSFWNPAHMVMYASGVIAAVFCGYLILATTFGRDAELRRHSVRIWGLRAPVGVFVACWGGLGVLYDAVFDNWWHNAYGLDVRFTSPPHLLFSLSLWSVMLGSLLLAFSYLNRSEREPAEGLNTGRLQAIVLYMGALLATAQMFACFSYTWDTKLHQAKAYVAVAIFLPVALAVMSWATRYRWTCTVMAAIYSAIHIGLILVLPLFAATPRLGPIYVPVTHFIPPRFPLLIVVPAVALDLLWQRRGSMSRAVEAMLSGALFVGLLVAVEWPFARFLLSPASANRFFGTRYLGFDDLTAPPDASLWQFQMPAHGVHLAAGLAAAVVCAAVGIYVGSGLGERLQLIRR